MKNLKVVSIRDTGYVDVYKIAEIELDGKLFIVEIRTTYDNCEYANPIEVVVENIRGNPTKDEEEIIRQFIEDELDIDGDVEGKTFEV